MRDTFINNKSPQRFKNNRLSNGIISTIGVTAILFYYLKGFYGQVGGVYFDNIVLLCSILFGSVMFAIEVKSFIVPKIARIYAIIMLIGWWFILFNNYLSQGFAFFPIIISSIGIAIWIYRTSKSNKRLHLFLSSFLIYSIIIYVFTIFYLKLNIIDYTNASRNHISVALLFISSYYCIIRRLNNISINLFTPIFVLLISVISVGTSGIISSLIFIFGFLFSKNKQAFILVALVVFSYIVFPRFIGLLNEIDSNLISKFAYERIGGGDIRYDIIDLYFSNITFKELIFGKPFDNLFWFVRIGKKAVFSDNLHNSYLLLHAKIGILIIPFFTIILIALLKLFKKDFLILFLFIAILARAFTDTVAFSHGYYEWSIFLMIIYAFDKKQTNSFTMKNMIIKGTSFKQKRFETISY